MGVYDLGWLCQQAIPPLSDVSTPDMRYEHGRMMFFEIEGKSKLFIRKNFQFYYKLY